MTIQFPAGDYSRTSPFWSPYGAYELKANYQRNMGLGMLITCSLVMLILAGFWLFAQPSNTPMVASRPVRVIEITAGPQPPPVVVPDYPIAPSAHQDVPVVSGIPEPVPDEMIADEDEMVIATRDQLRALVSDQDPGFGEGEGTYVVGDIEEELYIPDRNEFYSVEIYPEMVHRETPAYPRLARLAGLDGEVTVQTLVGPDGKVHDVHVALSSGTAALDEAAVEAAYECRFKPGIQNGMAVYCWVSFRYEFLLNH